MIDAQTQEGNVATAAALRWVLNEQSINAAYQLIRQPPSERDSILKLIASGQAKDAKAARQLYKQQKSLSSATESPIETSPIPSVQPIKPSCWNCQHRGEVIENQQLYCYYFGHLSLTEKSADTRGEECEKWVERTHKYNSSEYLTQANTFRLELPYTLKPIIEAVAAVEEMTASTWVAQLICNALRLDINNLP